MAAFPEGEELPDGKLGPFQAHLVALRGSARALLHDWCAHLRSTLGLSRPGAAWWPPSANQTAWPAALRAGA